MLYSAFILQFSSFNAAVLDNILPYFALLDIQKHSSLSRMSSKLIPEYFFNWHANIIKNMRHCRGDKVSPVPHH